MAFLVFLNCLKILGILEVLKNCKTTSVGLSLCSDSVSGQCRSVIGSQADRQHVFSMYFSHLFPLMVGREVDGLGFFGQSWAALVHYLGGLGPHSRPKLAVLGRSLRLSWWSRGALWA